MRLYIRPRRPSVHSAMSALVPAGEFSFSGCMTITHTCFHQRLELPHKQGIGSSKLTTLPFVGKETCPAIEMAYPLLSFCLWDGSANIAAHLLPVHRIGLEAKSPGLSCSTSSSAMVAMCKRGNSDCIPKKFVFNPLRPPAASSVKRNQRQLRLVFPESLFECIGFLGRVNAPEIVVIRDEVGIPAMAPALV